MTKETKNFDPEKKKAQVRFYCSAELRAQVYDYIAYKLRTTGRELPFSNALIDLVEMGLQMHDINSGDNQFPKTKVAKKSKFQQRLDQAMEEGEKAKELSDIKPDIPEVNPAENNHNK